MSKKKTLPNTTYIVLGILSRPEAEAGLSGYDIHKWAEGLRFFYWSPAQSQIYGELRRLAKLAYVTSEKVPQEGKPDKRVYQITDHGRAAFQEWVNHQPIEPTVMKHAMILRLFFGHAAEPAHLIEQLQAFVTHTKEALGQLAIVEEYADSQPDMAYQALVVEWGLRYYETELATAEQMLAKLNAPQT